MFYSWSHTSLPKTNQKQKQKTKTKTNKKNPGFWPDIWWGFSFYASMLYRGRQCDIKVPTRWRLRLLLLRLPVGEQPGVGAGCPPDTSHREISADLPGKERQGKKGKIKKGKVENWKWKEEKLQNEESTFFPTEKKHFTVGKNLEKWLCPLWKIFLLHPWRLPHQRVTE